MHIHDPISAVMLSIFVVIILAFVVVAFRTGRAYYGQPMLYVERDKQPITFWAVVAFMVVVLVQAGSLLFAQISH